MAHTNEKTYADYLRQGNKFNPAYLAAPGALPPLRRRAGFGKTLGRDDLKSGVKVPVLTTKKSTSIRRDIKMGVR